MLMRSSNTSFIETLTYMYYDKKVQILTIIFLSLIFESFNILINSYWISTSIFLTFSGIIAIVNYEKVQLRNEGFLPSDLLMLGSWNKIIGMVSPILIIASMITIVIIFFACYYLLKEIKFNFKWYFKVIIVLFTLLFGYGLGNSQQKNTIFYTIGHAMGNDPLYLAPVIAVQTNGPIINFMNNINVQIMEKPKGYSKGERKISCVNA